MSSGLMHGLEVKNKFLHGSNKDMIFNQATLLHTWILNSPSRRVKSQGPTRTFDFFFFPMFSFLYLFMF